MGQSSSRHQGSKLTTAVRQNDAEAVRSIASSTPDAVLYKTFWKRRTPLMLACESGNVLIVTTVLWASEQALGENYTSHLNEPDASGNTAFILACKRDHPTIASLLLEEGANPVIANRRRETALHVAAHRGNLDCVQLILDAPVDASMTGGGSSGIVATTMVGSYGGESRYMDAHSNVGFAPLHLATISTSHLCVAALVDRGAALDVPVLRGLERYPFLCGGSTALHIAAGQGDARSCLILLEGQRRHPGVDVRHMRNMLGLTPLNCALLSGYHDVARLMIEHGRRRPRGGGFYDGQELRRHTRILGTLALSSPIPEALRTHMQAVLQRAVLLLQLKGIYKTWQAEGIAKPLGKKASDVATVLSGLESLSLSHIQHLQKLMQRPDASLREVLRGLESALHPSRAGSEGGDSLSEDDDDYDNERQSRRSTHVREGASSTMTATVDWTMLGRQMLPRRGPSSLQAQTRRRTRRRRRHLEQQPRGDVPDALDPEDLERALAEVSERVGFDDGRPDGDAEIGLGVGGGPIPLVDVNGESEGVKGTKGMAGKGAPKGGESSLAKKTDRDKDDCQICIDADVEVRFRTCDHSTCFECACRLCLRAMEAPTCPFCRQVLESIEPIIGAHAKCDKNYIDR